MAKPISAGIAITRISDERPRVEHEVDTHLVGVQQREQHQDRREQAQHDELDVDLAPVVVVIDGLEPCSPPLQAETVPACTVSSAFPCAVATRDRTLSRTAWWASDICT